MWRVVLGVAFLTGCWSSPRPPPPPAREIAISLAVQQVELANGLKLVVVPEPTASEVSVTIRYAVGSMDDPAGREGLAHVVEHLMFEQLQDGEALFDVLERSALGFSGFTSFDATVYSEHGAPSLLPQFLAVERARLQQACDTIPEAAFARQREIVRNELRERVDADRVLQAVHAGIYSSSHPLGRSRATPESVAAITRADACAFAAAHYAPNNAVVVLSGAVSLGQAQPLVEQSLGIVPRGQARTARSLAAAGSRRSVTVDAPTDRAWFVMSWPMPATAGARSRLRAVARMVAGLVNARVNGVVTLTELGAGDARVIALAVAPSSEISIADALDSTRYAISNMTSWFGSGLYEHAKYRAVFSLAASLDHSLDRDVRFADEVARGIGVKPDEDARTLLAMSRDEARNVARSQLALDRATVVTLRPAAPTTSPATSSAALAPTFREQRPRRPQDPSAARRPAESVAVDDPFQRARSHTLANGLSVVMLPMATMPIVDIRLVLPTGTGDEPGTARGIATIAAHAIEPPFDADMFHFLQSGGNVAPDVGFDHTELSVQGLAANLDILLAGLATTVREGAYTVDDIRTAMSWQRLTSSMDRADGVATAVWRDALYGSEHPYRHAGLWAHARRSFEVTAVERFREQHYRPRGATLIIAGRFDPALAVRWAEHAFSDWTGDQAVRSNREATLQPLAFAQVQTGTQIAVRAAWSAPTDDDVALEIVVEMIEEAIADVREQIAASYGLRALVVRHRSSTTIELRGAVDATRARESLALLRDRIARLRTRSDETASLFVTARRHVLARLASVDTTATSLADQATTEAATGRSRPSLERAQLMTLDAIEPLFDKIELANAAILLRGPERALREAYAAIGRQPAML